MLSLAESKDSFGELKP